MTPSKPSHNFELALPGVYDELHAVAERALHTERPNHTLQPTALVHEAYLRLCHQQQESYQNRAQFFALASRMIRRILVDYARYKSRSKRAGQLNRVSLANQLAVATGKEVEIIALHQAMEKLATIDPRKSRLVELRFFGGLTVAEAAKVLAIAESTAAEDWVFARAWLRHELRDDEDE